MKHSHLFNEAFNIQYGLFKRSVDIYQNSIKIAAKKPKMELIKEIHELNDACSKRATAMQKIWANDWAEWLQYANSVTGAQTLPKFAERTNNISMQAQAQIAKQTNEFTELLENTSVSYSYWLAKQLER